MEILTSRLRVVEDMGAEPVAMATKKARLLIIYELVKQNYQTFQSKQSL